MFEILDSLQESQHCLSCGLITAAGPITGGRVVINVAAGVSSQGHPAPQLQVRAADIRTVKTRAAND